MDANATTAPATSGISRTEGLLYLLAGVGAAVAAVALLFAVLSRAARSVADSPYAPALVRAVALTLALAQP